MEKQKLEILVVEDNALHQEAARALLAEHNVTIVGTFDDAADRIYGPSALAIERGANPKGSYDVIITDLFFPQGRGDMMADKNMAKEEMPFGYAVAMMAMKEGVEYIAIASDANHHSHPMAYTLDFFLEGRNPQVMNIDVIGAGCSDVAVINTAYLEQAYRTPDGRIGTKEEIGEEGTVLKPSPGFDDDETIEVKGKIVPDDAEPVKNYKAILNMLMGKQKDINNLPKREIDY
jgi:CheY-like chemotaxis protein